MNSRWNSRTTGPILVDDEHFSLNNLFINSFSYNNADVDVQNIFNTHITVPSRTVLDAFDPAMGFFTNLGRLGIKNGGQIDGMGLYMYNVGDIEILGNATLLSGVLVNYGVIQGKDLYIHGELVIETPSSTDNLILFFCLLWFI